ncbi:GNAT family N-acetyltransferase [Halobacterium yunchengense]|uniref:GNAT family N-acetyltransferase n=1 Tax=Halobacterium yunchengense TaxID=3108497 RepID=UPI00300B7E2C
MHLQRLPADEAAVRRFVEDLWLPYHRELEAVVDAHGLADDADLVAEEVPFRVDRLASADYRLWVAVDGADADGSPADGDAASGDGDAASVDVDIAAGDGTLAGFASAEVAESPSVFDHPDRVHLGDVYVRGADRGTGLAVDLVDRVAAFARERDCREIALDVDVDNDRALAFYEKLGFDALRRTLSAPVDDLGGGD